MFDNGLGFTMMLVSTIFVLVTTYYLFVLFKEIFTKKRTFQGNGVKGIEILLFSFVLLGGIGYCLYKAPYALYNSTWALIDEFGPSSLMNAVKCLIVVIPMFFLYYMLSYFFVKKGDKPYFMIVVLSILSGIGNSMVIFVINAALSRVMNDESRRAGVESGLYLFYILGIALFTVSAMVVRKKLIVITSEVVYDKRIQIINKLMQAPYDKFEALEDGNIHAALNNDTENVSGFVNAFVNGLTGVITLVTCFIYLATINFLGMVISVLVICGAVGAFLIASKNAEKMFEKNRDIQNTFFKYINDMLKGFKELYINKRKGKEFTNDIKKSCEDYRDTRVQAEFDFVGVSILGEILYIGVVGIVVFIFPLLFPNLQNNTLRNYVLVYLYMGGIVNQEIFLVPGVMRVLVSWRRINQFIKDISCIESNEKKADHKVQNSKFDIKVKDVVFQYKNENGEKFRVGPINCDFKSGEIIFISGGNGSGKSTLAKLITGLYTPDEGEISINGEKADQETLGSYFSAIFGDYYLFDKMYGIDYQSKTEEIRKYLKVLRIDDKVQVKDGLFSSTKLSTGQRKRLALLVSYLEERPAYLFDEWAADQDPEFRKFFYKVLLPELKARGKTIIAITHDDSYFDDADKHIKMETGQILEYKVNLTVGA
ncbi:cyclic peptide transporter [Ruminiclostridium cellobioparum subsp. termitidis CT1112]|uniref:Cyclic peptide transporter n=1 Tax=Ruminiclostridium cellobioparum subsp. termitidis CT1112 TaxID=1195236 RepID=S0FTP8_RUMCE|nr:cyclic peptide transporter [Ruminiclostridium cellobioparum subsp. termitidis CT1112]